MVRRTRPGISRFSDVQLHIVVRCFASPRNDGWSGAALRTSDLSTTIWPTRKIAPGRFLKMRSSNASLCIVALVFGICCGLDPARAQSYPSRTITVVVPFAPGGSTSIVGRVIADKMSQQMGQGIVIDHRPGAGGTVGTKAVAKSPPDGYTLLLGYTGTLAIGPSLYANAGFEPRKDFAAIGRIGSAPTLLWCLPSLPVHSVAELIAYARANPGAINYGSAGIGTVGHLAGELLATM